MRFVSLFAGIGGFDLALSKLGHECVYSNDFDKFCKITYDKHFKQKLDIRPIATVSADEIPDHDLLVGGFPCQSFSVAGRRRGFEDTRGTLFFEICRIIQAKRTPYLLLENVKGLLSHDDGKTFYTIIRSLDQLGYDIQWQVLNSRYFGVPQNRERVFIIGNLRGKSRPQIFPFQEGNGDTVPGNREGKSRIADTITGRYASRNGRGTHISRFPLKFANRNQRNIEGDYAYTIDRANTGGIAIGTLRTFGNNKGFRKMRSNLSPAILARGRQDGGGQPVVSTDTKIRRLTPIECERLQGFPDNWTEGISDAQRYKQLGNAVTVNVVYEIMKRFII